MSGDIPSRSISWRTTPLQQGVEVETALLSIQAGIVTLTPVQEEDDEELRRSMQEGIGVGALTRVSGLRIRAMNLTLALPFLSGPRFPSYGLCFH